MISRRLLLILGAAPLLIAPAAPPASGDATPAYSVEFDLSADESLAPVAEKLRSTFNRSYPKLVERFQNPDHPAPTHIPVIFEKGLDHPAHAAGGKLTFSVEWFKQHPNDLGVITHETMHIVQGYRSRRNPGWLVEGMADYARALYGPKTDGWKMPERL
ncbi:MAG TPA: basic secretory protein-like protein, partial [Armatimonadota bacterium]|nr:basic secretory protein-like protein [Armatimonadota bacterium]